MDQQKELSWQAPEYQDYQKHPIWFVIFAVIIALLVLFGIYTDSWTTSLTFLLIGIMGVVYASRKPSIVNVTLSGTGITVNNFEYPHKTIKKFWILYTPPDVKALYIETSAYLNKIVKLELGSTDPRVVREFLKQYLEEDLDQEESVVDIISRKIKF